MSKTASLHIDLDAAQALIHWKSVFGDAVAEHARRLAIDSGQPERVTLLQYREAAHLAIRSLSAEICDGETPRADRKVA